jgi:uncharacterized protein with LGFP repeats
VTAPLALAAAIAFALAAPPIAGARTTDTTVARDVSGPVDGKATFELPIEASHVALHWRGRESARVRVAFSRDGEHFGRGRAVELDEVAEQRQTRETYGSVVPAPDVTAVRVWSDRRLPRATVLAMSDTGPTESARTPGAEAGDGVSAAAAAQPPVTSRAGWGADESLRFDSAGNEKWAPEFHPTQKLIVHHTAGRNDDPDPPATVRSIYYYHAITQGFGDIGYNFLVDESGRVYEGRYSREYATGESPTGEDLNGNGVTAAHAQGFNSGTTGVALLGTLTDRDAAAAARESLEGLLAWEAERHDIDPLGASLYTNPVNGTQKTFDNIAGHRDVGATECPGSAFYATLPQLRQAVAARLGGEPPSTVKSYRPSGYATTSGSVYNGRGAVSRLYEDDGSRVEVNSAKSNGTHVSEIRPEASIGDSERASLKRLTADYDGNATGSSTSTTLRIFNFSAGAWETVDGPRKGVTTDRFVTWSNAKSPADYVSANGTVRYSIKATRSKSFRTRTDLVRFTIEY